MPDRILFIEDEEDLVITLTDRLLHEGYSVTSAADGYRGQRKAESAVFDLILLDIMLPGQDGYEVCRNLRKKRINTPILMLTARDTNIDMVTGLRSGADDYLAKPFDVSVLLARIEALLRRPPRPAEPSPNHRYRIGAELVLDTRRQELLKGNNPIELKAQEYKLLKFFAENPNRVLNRNEILDQVWDYDAITTRTVDVHVAWLRRKLGENKAPRYLHTVRGFGYRFTPED